MIWASIFGYLAIGVSFYLYITRTAQIEPDTEVELVGATPTLTILAGGAGESAGRKAA